MTGTSRVSLRRIEEASASIDPVFARTPQFVSEPLSARLGTRMLLKVESVNPIRSFKGRGTDYFMGSLRPGTHIVSASAGNFGQGLAYAARRRQITTTIFAATNASPLKIGRMRALGASVTLYGSDLDEAKAEGKRWATERGLHFVEDGREPAIAEGAGTIGLELNAWPERIDILFVPVGNGALIAGVGTWMKAHSPSTKIVGVVAEGAPAMARSWESGRIKTTASVMTIADGIAIRAPIPEAVADVQPLIDEYVRVPDEATLQAMRWLYEDTGLLIEPAGAVGVAAATAHRGARPSLVATILCGGNMTDAQVRKWVLGDLSETVRK